MHKHHHIMLFCALALASACDPFWGPVDGGDTEGADYGDTDIPEVEGVTPCEAIAARENKHLIFSRGDTWAPDADVVGPPVYWGPCGGYGFHTWCVSSVGGLRPIEGAQRVSLADPVLIPESEERGLEVHLWAVADGDGYFSREDAGVRQWAPIVDVGGPWRLVTARWGRVNSAWLIAGLRWQHHPEPGTSMLGEAEWGIEHDFASHQAAPVGGGYADGMISVVSADGELGWRAITGACLLSDTPPPDGDEGLDGTSGG